MVYFDALGSNVCYKWRSGFFFVKVDLLYDLLYLFLLYSEALHGFRPVCIVVPTW